MLRCFFSVLPSACARPHSFLGLTLLLATFVFSGSASALTFELHNHPDGNESPPPYGLRLDELFDVTGGKDVFTFNFEAPGAAMTLVYDDGGTGNLNDDTVTISGVVFGGLVTAGAHSDPLYTGLWDVSFSYTTNFVSAGGGSDIEIDPSSPSNSGTITPQFAVGGNPANDGVPIPLVDETGNNDFSFKFNNTDNHRLGGTGLSGPETYVGWGWLNHSGEPHVKASDWIFTGKVVPEPSTAMLLGIGLLGVASRRQR